MQTISFQEYQYKVLKKLHESGKHTRNAAIIKILGIEHPTFPLEIQLRNKEFYDLLRFLLDISTQSDEDESTKKIVSNWWIQNYKIVACPTFSPQNPDWTVCTCDCHTRDDMVHPTPCCSVCPLCGERVMTGCEKEHAQTC